jgi:hypothetical protein
MMGKPTVNGYILRDEHHICHRSATTHKKGLCGIIIAMFLAGFAGGYDGSGRRMTAE